MFRVEKEEYVNKTFRMPVKLIKELEQLAQKEEVSLNNLVIQCCKYSLANQSSSEQWTKKAVFLDSLFCSFKTIKTFSI